MKNMLICFLLFTIAVLPANLFAKDDYQLLYRSPQVEHGFTGIGLHPQAGRFTARFDMPWSSATIPILEGFDLDGKRIWELDESRWHAHSGAGVPGKDLVVLTELSICPKPVKIENCDSEPEGYMFNVASGTILYHGEKFVRNHPDFTTDGKYMLGKYGWGYSDEGGGEYSPSTGTCLMEVDTGREIWCSDEVVSDHEAWLSEESKIIVVESGVYDLFSGNKLLSFPQYSKKGDRLFKPQRPVGSVTIRAVSPDGRYFVATEGKCDAEMVRRLGKEVGCHLVRASDLETYMGEWDKGVVKKKVKVFEESFPTMQITPFYFLPDGVLVLYEPYPPHISMINVKGETVSEISNEKAANISPLAVWRLQPRVSFENKVVEWPSSEYNNWRVYDFSGDLVGEFLWKEPQGRESQVRSFAMINSREFIFSVDITTKKRKDGARMEYVAEVYRGKFGD